MYGRLLDQRKNEASTLKTADDETTKAVRTAIDEFKQQYARAAAIATK